MKNNSICVIIMMIILFSTTVSKAQINCDEVKKENAYLKKALKVTSPTKTITSSKIDFNLIKCEGNIKEQTVNLVLTLVNHAANTVLQFSSAEAIDLEGDEYKYDHIYIGSATYRNNIYTDTPIKVNIKFAKVLPSIKLFKLIPIKYYDNENLGGTIGIEYKDVPISWK